MKKTILATLLYCLANLVVFSQAPGLKLTGKVTNDKNEALPGATISVKGSPSSATVADKDGRFNLKVTSLPVTLQISEIESEQKEITVTSAEELAIILKAGERVLIGVTINAPDRRISGDFLRRPTTTELITIRDFNNSPLTPYDILKIKKGIYGTTSGLLFNTYSSRGFNGSGTTRVIQRFDGMDNQTPGLNFAIGNFVSSGDLEYESIAYLSGPSAALYGPGGMNGTVIITTKDPFDPKYQGLSMIIKPGVMHIGSRSPRENSSMYQDYAFRFAKSFNNKFAFKIGAQYITADDWLANDSSNYDRSGTSGKLKPGTRTTDPNYDGVNVYGDETSVDIYPFLYSVLGPNHPLLEHIPVSRTGYQEKDIIDPQTKSIKLNGAFHYKINDKLEALMEGYWATGNTVYTDDNRYALKGIKLGQYKIELKSKKWFLRGYTTQEDAGEAYSATVATQYFNEAWKRSFDPNNISGSWYPQFTGAYLQARVAGVDKPAALNIARSFADQGRPEAGSTLFHQIFDQVRKTPIPNGGLFKEKSQLWMGEGQYSFGDAKKNAEVIIGGNYKKYILDSDGTLFIDSVNAININEIGGYAQVSRSLFDDYLTITASGRFDKNENFKTQFTPRFAALIKVAKDNNLRLSYQTAYRFAGNLAQWIRLDVGGDYLLLGGLPWVWDFMQADKYPVYLINGTTPDTNPYVYKEFKPETMRSFEIGYKGLINKKLMIDAYTYFGSYKDFLGRIGLYQPATDRSYSITVNSSNAVKTHGFGLGLDYLVGKNFSAFFNISSDVITDVPSGFKSYFNAPKYKLSTGIANSGFGKEDRLSFNVLMRWQDAFQWEGELANGPLNAITTVDGQVGYKFPKVKTTIRLGGTNLLNHYYKNAFANPSIGGLYYASFIYNL